MTVKFKILFAGMVLLVLLAAGAAFFFLLQNHKNLSLKNENLAKQISLLQHRLKLSQKSSRKVLQKKTIYGKNSKKPLSQIPPDCSSCFSSAKMEIDLTDEKGWWRYHDPNAFDDKAGDFTLTDSFWEDVVPPVTTQPVMESTGRRKRIRRNSEKAVRAGIGLSGYEMEMSYSPFGLHGKKWSLDFDLCTSLSSKHTAFHTSTQTGFNPNSLQADFSLGLTFRW